MQYYKKPNSIKISQINNKYHSLHPSEHRVPKIPKKNFMMLREMCEKEDVGAQIDVSEYLTFTTNCYLQNISCMEETIINEKAGKNISPLLYRRSNKKIEAGDFCISRNASIGKITYVPEKINAVVNGGISFFTFKEKYKFYVPAFFITNYGKDTLECLTSGGGTQQNVKRETLLNLKIPFPIATKENTRDEIVEYVSELVSSLINKEVIIKQKVLKINNIIDKEMEQSQKKVQYVFPRISEIKKTSHRLDTGLYGKTYKGVVKSIVNYPKGYKYIRDLKCVWISGKTPDIVILHDNGKYWWIAVGDMSYGLKYKGVKRINTCENVSSNILSSGDILITRKGATVGKVNMYFDELKVPAFVNEDIKVLRLKESDVDKVFIGMFLNSHYGQMQMLNLASRGTKQGLTNDNILNIIFPSFEEEIKKDIFLEYYNNSDYKWNEKEEDFVSYDKKRSEELGIYQINMEIFRIREKLEYIVQKIVANEEVEVDYSFML